MHCRSGNYLLVAISTLSDPKHQDRPFDVSGQNLDKSCSSMSFGLGEAVVSLVLFSVAAKLAWNVLKTCCCKPKAN